MNTSAAFYHDLKQELYEFVEEDNVLNFFSVTISVLEWKSNIIVVERITIAFYKRNSGIGRET